MADDGMDPCECIWSHELSMRRLLSLLRQSQAYCTDTECIDVSLPRNTAQDTDNVLLMTIFFMLAIFMFYLRPRAQNALEDPAKPSSSGNGSSGAPPPSPAAM